MSDALIALARRLFAHAHGEGGGCWQTADPGYRDVFLQRARRMLNQ